MRNKIFQWLFYRVVRPLCKTEGANKIEVQYSRMIAQIRLARLFGGARRVMIGDSNSAVFCNYEAMCQFKAVTLALGVGGTTAHDWILFFNTTKGRVIFDYISEREIVWNIGGNYVNWGIIEQADAGLTALRMLTPSSWNCTCPPVRAGILEAISTATGKNKTADSWQKDFLYVNGIISRTWSPQCIDLFNVFNDPTQNEAYFFALRDMEHFSKYAVKIIKSIVEVSV